MRTLRNIIGIVGLGLALSGCSRDKVSEVTPDRNVTIVYTCESPYVKNRVDELVEGATTMDRLFSNESIGV